MDGQSSCCVVRVCRRYASKRNTCGLVSLSLNLAEHAHSVIGSIEKLHHSSYKLTPVPLPIGAFEVSGRWVVSSGSAYIVDWIGAQAAH